MKTHDPALPEEFVALLAVSGDFGLTDFVAVDDRLVLRDSGSISSRHSNRTSERHRSHDGEEDCGRFHD